MRQAVMYTRVSSKDQEREGYSIPAQQALLHEYAAKAGFQLVREFVDVETAKVAGRKAFGEMVSFLKQHRDCRVVLAEKTDRLYRNFKDYVVLEDLDIEIHLPKEGHIIGKDSRSRDRLIHGIKVVLARNYIDNLREEVTKGLREKAEQGVFPVDGRRSVIETIPQPTPSKFIRKMLPWSGGCSSFTLPVIIRCQKSGEFCARRFR